MYNIIKRLFTLFLTAIIFVSSVYVYSAKPADLSTTEDTYDYLFWDFNKGDVIPHTVNTGSSKDSNNKTFYPFLSKYNNASVSQEDITVLFGGNQKTVSTLKIQASQYSSIIFTDKNGKPFEARPNVKYTVKVKAYVKSFGKWSQFFYGFGFFISEIGFSFFFKNPGYCHSFFFFY